MARSPVTLWSREGRAKLFEEDLQDRPAILDIDSSNISLDLTSKDFVRIRGAAVFHDVKQLKRTLEGKRGSELYL